MSTTMEDTEFMECLQLKAISEYHASSDEDMERYGDSVYNSPETKKKLLEVYVMSEIKKVGNGSVTPAVAKNTADLISSSLKGKKIIIEESENQAMGTKLIEEVMKLVKLPGYDFLRVIVENDISLENIIKKFATEIEEETQSATPYLGQKDMITIKQDENYFIARRDQEIEKMRKEESVKNDFLQIKPTGTRSASSLPGSTNEEEKETSIGPIEYRKSKAEFEEHIRVKSISITEHFRNMYVTETTNYNLEVQKVNEAKRAIARFKNIKENLSNCTCIANAAKIFINDLTTIVKETIVTLSKKFHSLLTTVQGLCTIPLTGEKIQNSFKLSNIAGMVNAIKFTYNGNEFETLMDQLANLLQFRIKNHESNTDAWARLLVMFGVWNQLGIFEKLTPETLFMAVYLNGHNVLDPNTERYLRERTDLVEDLINKSDIFGSVNTYLIKERRTKSRVVKLNSNGGPNINTSSSQSNSSEKNQKSNSMSSGPNGKMPADLSHKKFNNGGYRSGEFTGKSQNMMADKFTGTKRGVNEESVAATSEVEKMIKVVHMNGANKQSVKFSPKSKVITENDNGDVTHIYGVPTTGVISKVSDKSFQKHVSPSNTIKDAINIYDPRREVLSLNYPEKSSIDLIDANDKSRLTSDVIVRTDKIKIRDRHNPSRIHDYIAVPSLYDLCATCYPLTGKGILCPRRGSSGIKCYNEKCPKCDLYGHEAWSCLQRFRSDGTTRINHNDPN